MYIAPNTNVKILKDVPLDTDYGHTLFCATLNGQTNFFLGKEKYSLSEYSYQRVNSQKIKVGIAADNLYDCNYLMFQNTAFSNKWFYAFIKSVEYENNQTSVITYEIDVMQTWYFDYGLEMCFIDRQHTATDVIGEHIESEPVDVGEYVMNNYESLIDMTSMLVCLAICDVDQDVQGELYDGIYGGAGLWVYDSSDVTSINAKISEYNQKPDAILAAYMIPKAFMPEIPASHKLTYGASAMKTTKSLSAINPQGDTLNGYKPKNMKMYTYPYNYLHVDNASGGSLQLRYEFFQSKTPVLEMSGTITQPVQAILRPCSYKGVKGYSELGGYTTLNTENIKLDNYPMCSWATDAYQAWVAQNAIPLGLGAISNVGNIAVGSVMSTNPYAMIATGAIGQVASLLSQGYKASIAADISRGTLNNGGGNVSNRKQQFYYGRCSITAQYARMIDDFFTMYGYAIKRCRRPNISARPHWTYIKTVGCNLTGSVPCDDLKKIISIYDNGVTFWRVGSEIGDYSLDNSP